MARDRPSPYGIGGRSFPVVRGPVLRVFVSPRSFRTLISIEYVMCQVLKVRRTLMFLTAVRLLPIKDLKALSFFYRRFSIDMQDLKDLKRHRSPTSPSSCKSCKSCKSCSSLELPIKDLKALSVFWSVGYYRHVGPKGPKEMSFSLTSPRRLSVSPAPPCN